MKESDDQEKKNKRIGMITSAGIHILLFLIFLFLTAWRAPNPPLPEYGIELNFGLDAQGGGEVQPETPVGNETEQNEEAITEAAENQPEEVIPDEKETVEETIPEKAAEQNTSEVESPVTTKEEKKETKTEAKKEKPVEAAAKEKVITEYKKEAKTNVDPDDASKKGLPGSQGDDPGKVGDKGSPEGTLDAKALYGNQGGGGGGDGLGLAMAGWKWADDPKVPELQDDNGKVIFEIVCDENGEIRSVETKETSLSFKTVQILKELIYKNSLERTSGGAVPDRSKGRVVFILKSK